MNAATLVQAMPGLSATLAAQYLGPMESAMQEYAINTELRARMFLAQVGHESVSLRYFEEIASGAAYEGRLDLGNTQKGDGVRFKGRGPIQITGRTNYTQAGAALGLPLVANPPMAADPRYAFRVSAWWWWAHGLNPISDRSDVVGATKRINGGTNGLSDRQARYTRCLALGATIIPGPATPPAKGRRQMSLDFLKSADYNHAWWFIANGPNSYWRPIPDAHVKDIPNDAALIDTKDQFWLHMWKVGEKG